MSEVLLCPTVKGVAHLPAHGTCPQRAPDNPYRGTSLIRKRPPLEVPTVGLCPGAYMYGGIRGGRFLMSEVPL